MRNINCNKHTFRFLSLSIFIDLTHMFASPKPHYLGSLSTHIPQDVIKQTSKQTQLYCTFSSPQKTLQMHLTATYSRPWRSLCQIGSFCTVIPSFHVLFISIVLKATRCHQGAKPAVLPTFEIWVRLLPSSAVSQKSVRDFFSVVTLFGAWLHWNKVFRLISHTLSKFPDQASIAQRTKSFNFALCGTTLLIRHSYLF